ncbi:M3 family oligoendopeptidase [Metabacillus idriensis]|uniref:M3 family oligoendopeptidase n=1 Tax=Metabacillus idriensis TaxID=324768 RepID=UPI00163A9243|nr:M3 family oligoendopeptidase [Metabacillus idriensis]QNG60522.1 M3 family oligoendopeptidase [Bacillus sp. PAMC26568]
MKAATYVETWDLDVFFEGGSGSEAFKKYLEELALDVPAFKDQAEHLKVPQSAADSVYLDKILEKFQGIAKRMRQAGAFVGCLQAQNTNDKHASILRGKITQLSSQFQNALAIFDQKLVKVEDTVWTELVNSETLAELKFALSERRGKAKNKLPIEQETIINAMSVDGYHAWGQLYDTLVSKVKIPFEEDGKMKELSVGQAANKFSSGDRSVRQSVFNEWEKAWGSQADLFAHTLNHLSGFRLNVYEKRGWDDVLSEPLEINRMKRETLDVMWKVISENKQPLVNYLKRKAELLGVEKLSWFDLDAPIGGSETKVSYQEGAEFILDQFSNFGEQLTSFTEKAFADRWIEAEDRPGKAPGGFCTSFTESDQSRIFMTFSGTPSNIATLAHELGHAFHQHAMAGVHPLNRNYAMNVAETASTFAEMIVADASVKKAKTEEERLALLEDKVQRSVALLMNIHGRFLFETSFYAERKKGIVSTEKLNTLMEDAQREAYCDSLGEYHPHFWASKLHFYITGVPFYNFPYTFGYLFSLGIYAKALEEGAAFEEKYIALLKDTGSMQVEDLAMKHLGVDLTKEDFWKKAVLLTVQDVEEFLEATK